MKDRRDRIGAWLDTPLGAALCERERVLVAQALDQAIGLQLLQVGVWGAPQLFLDHARTTRRTLVDVLPGPGVAMRCDPCQLGVAQGSVDALLLPHTLELHDAPHEVLREAERVLAGEGRLIVLGFNPHGLWGARRALSRGRFPSGVQRFIGEGRLIDWLTLLGFEMEVRERYGYQLPFQRAAGGDGRLETLGARYWPRLSAGYLLMARKRVYTFTPARPVWNRKRGVVGGLVEPMTRSGTFPANATAAPREPALSTAAVKSVELYTDGACSGNPGPGGWGVLLLSGEREKTLSGGERETTNNRMELIAAIEGLRALKQPCQVVLYTDSAYVRKGITEWLPRWRANGWRTADRKPVKNQDLWEALAAAMAPHSVDWRWVPAHSGIEGNERVDALARAAARACAR